MISLPSSYRRKVIALDRHENEASSEGSIACTLKFLKFASLVFQKFPEEETLEQVQENFE